jgi:DNA-directed RNA polymerase subunit RPC12/RpoP
MAKCIKCKDEKGRFIDSAHFVGQGYDKDGKQIIRFKCVRCGETFEVTPPTKVNINE